MIARSEKKFSIEIGGAINEKRILHGLLGNYCIPACLKG
jgi:hypothetical protein